MTDQPQLYARRRHELDQLLGEHLSADTLDEGNAAAFDLLIDAWLQEELARIDVVAAELARNEVQKAHRDRAAEARVRQEHESTDAAEASYRLEREERRQAKRRRRERAAEVRRARRAQRLDEVEQRLRAATARLQHAELRLIGTLTSAPPAATARDRVFEDVAERVA